MSHISYPQDWIGSESIGLIVNYPELTKLAKANGLNSGHLSYLVEVISNATLQTINKMVEEADKNAES